MSEPLSPSGLRIIFMGTPEFAVPSLKALVEAGENVIAVVTAPDKPSGRGLKLMPTPVKEYALTQNLNILQPEKLKDPQFLQALTDLKADFQVVVAFRMLPEVVWNMPPKGTINLHSSLLPQYRGAAPINWAIINGEKETGVTTFFLQHEIDTGNIIFQEKEPIYPTDNAGTLYARLMDKGAQLIVKTVQAVANNSAPSVPQVFAETLKLMAK
jgi:methionyl-tRNA formyltransferase